MNPTQLNNDVKRMLKETSNSFKLRPEDIVVCSVCGGELFLSPIRLAKTKMNLVQDVLGLVSEPPRAYCYNCKHELSPNLSEIKTVSDVVVTAKTIEPDSVEEDKATNIKE